MNISQFAAFAGVSKSAVSRYFNNGYLSDDKRKLIEEAIEKTGYVPSIQAQNVRTRVTKLVGVILPRLSSESCARVTEGINEILSEQGYQLLLACTNNDINKEIEYLELFRQNRVDGIIFLASIFTDMHKKIINKLRVPIIIVGQEYKGYSCLCHDDYGAAKALTSLMLEKGRKKPACIYVTKEDKAAGLSRYRGFVEALKENEISIRDTCMLQSGFTMDCGYDVAKKLFSGKEIPDCLFCATDTIAAGAIRYCRENDIRIPEDVMVTSVGDSALCKILSVSLTSAHLHYKTSGKDAALMLITALKRPDAVPRIMRLDFQIEERESTGC